MAGISYAISKIVAELYLEMSGLNFIVFRSGSVYRPRNFNGSLQSFYNNIVNYKVSKKINSKRDHIFVDDVVSWTINALVSDVNNDFF